MSGNEIDKFPEEDARGLAYHVAQTALGAADMALPGAGYALQQIVGHYVGEPLEKRREEWFRRVGSALLELQRRFDGFDPATLTGNEEFVSAVYETSHLAMRTHRETKREALLNVVLNTAVGYSIDDVLRGRFMALIDNFSAAHIRVLQVLQKPNDYERCVARSNGVLMGPQETIIRAEITPQEISEELFRLVISDLNREGLIDGSLSGMVSSNTFLAKRSTATGDSFLRFVSSPLQ